MFFRLTVPRLNKLKRNLCIKHIEKRHLNNYKKRSKFLKLRKTILIIHIQVEVDEDSGFEDFMFYQSYF